MSQNLEVIVPKKIYRYIMKRVHTVGNHRREDCGTDELFAYCYLKTNRVYQPEILESIVRKATETLESYRLLNRTEQGKYRLNPLVTSRNPHHELRVNVADENSTHDTGRTNDVFTSMFGVGQILQATVNIINRMGKHVTLPNDRNCSKKDETNEPEPQAAMEELLSVSGTRDLSKDPFKMVEPEGESSVEQINALPNVEDQSAQEPKAEADE
ncbi:uncharacterized protein LOC129720694 [Wyeomyia smithii]|uniref:uncharacterized protein LOC129720694 n=1 Tax=Wyeomyia smithii TaxID=174621 RepID=UPI002467D412|nr:uncharacterized protein LOC129720694 [Wyeomyia smithii]